MAERGESALMKARPTMRNAVARWCRWLLISTTVAVTGLAVYPGCATNSSAPSTPAEFARDEHRRLYDSAMWTLQKRKSRGELAGIEPTAEGTFSATWLWFDQQDPYGDHRLRVVFKYKDGRPDRKFDIVNQGRGLPPDWQPVAAGRN